MRDSKDTNPPPDHQRCTIIGWKWRCKRYKFRNSKFCRKHYFSYRGTIDGLSMKDRATLFGTHFREGDEVEVLRKDESLKLSGWFKAKILKLPPNSRNPEEKQILVDYDRVDLAMESVDFSLVRPLPVQEMKSFDENQRIEVFCNGGWWKGEIFEAVGNGRFMVGCPIWGEKRDVGVDELRIHQAWVDEEWVVPQLKDAGTDCIANELDQKRKAPMSRSISLSGQRTMPLRITESCTTTMERDLAQMGTDCIATELDQKRKAPMPRSRGRPRKKMHKEDSGGVSLSGQRTTPLRITESCTTTMETDLAQMGTDGIANESDQRKRKAPSRPRGRPRKNMQKEDKPIREGPHLHDSTGIFASSSRLLDHQTASSSQKISTLVSSSSMFDLRDIIPHTDVADVIQTEWPSHGDGLDTLTSIEDAPSLSDQVASKPSLAIVPVEASMDVTVQVEGAGNQMDRRHDDIDIFTNLPIHLSDGAEGDSFNSQVQLLQMSTNINGDENNQQKRAAEEQRNDVPQPSAQGFTSNLPFTKSYPLWETLESMEIFKSMPQSPHFKPLTEENEYIREGEAIGYMLSFLAAVEIIQKSKFDESNETMLETLNALKVFESHGFHVHLIKARLEKLLSIKSKLLEYDVERKQVEAEILNSKFEEKCQELNVALLTEKKSKLQELRSNLMKKREIVVTKKQANDSKITTLQMTIQETMDEMQKINLQFTSVAAKPW